MVVQSDLDSVENKKKISKNRKNMLNKNYLLLSLSSFKIIQIFKNAVKQNSLKILGMLLIRNINRFFTQHL